MAVKAQIEKLLPPPTESFLYKVRREPHLARLAPPSGVPADADRRAGGEVRRGPCGPLRSRGCVALTGPNLPHMWCSSRDRTPGEKQPDEAFMIQFPEGMVGGSLLGLPEMAPIRRLLDASPARHSLRGGRPGEGAKAMARMKSLRRSPPASSLSWKSSAFSRKPAARRSSPAAPSPRPGPAGDRERIDRICRSSPTAPQGRSCSPRRRPLPI